MRQRCIKCGKSYVDKLDARKYLDFGLFKTTSDFFIDQKRFLPDLSYNVQQCLTTCFLNAVRQIDNTFDN